MTSEEKFLPRVILLAMIALVIIGVLGAICCAPDTKAHAQYAKLGTVTQIDRESDLVTFTDYAGHSFSFYGVEDWDIGDLVAAVMDDNGTEIVTDDIIVDVRYERLPEMKGE
jgi:hypothetical protein